MGEHPAVTTFREYLKIPSVHPDPDYRPCVEFIRKQAAILNLPLSEYGTKEKPVVLLTWKGTRPDLPSILLNSHMDVVPVYPEKWTYPPFAAHKTNDGKIYGRGSQDMKILTILYLVAIQELKSIGFRPMRTVHLLHVPDEEIGGAEGMEKFVETPEFKALNVGMALDEGLSSGEDKDYFIVYNDERCKWCVKVHCSGPTGHGSLLHSNTAGEKVRIVLDEFLDRRAREVEKTNGNTNDMTNIGYVTTINLTMVEGGVQNNVVPPCITLNFDIRLSVNENHDDFLKWIEDVCSKAGDGTSFEFTLKDKHVPATPVDESNHFWIAFKDVLDKLGKKFVVSPCCGATDMRFIRKHNIRALGFTPLKNCPLLMHDNDEYVPEKDFIDGINVYVQLIKALTAVS